MIFLEYSCFYVPCLATHSLLQFAVTLHRRKFRCPTVHIYNLFYGSIVYFFACKRLIDCVQISIHYIPHSHIYTRSDSFNSLSFDRNMNIALKMDKTGLLDVVQFHIPHISSKPRFKSIKRLLSNCFR